MPQYKKLAIIKFEHRNFKEHLKKSFELVDKINRMNTQTIQEQDYFELSKEITSHFLVEDYVAYDILNDKIINNVDFYPSLNFSGIILYKDNMTQLGKYVGTHISDLDFRESTLTQDALKTLEDIILKSDRIYKVNLVDNLSEIAKKKLEDNLEKLYKKTPYHDCKSTLSSFSQEAKPKPLVFKKKSRLSQSGIFSKKIQIPEISFHTQPEDTFAFTNELIHEEITFSPSEPYTKLEYKLKAKNGCSFCLYNRANILEYSESFQVAHASNDQIKIKLTLNLDTMNDPCFHQLLEIELSYYDKENILHKESRLLAVNRTEFTSRFNVK